MDKKTFKEMNYLPENLKFEEGVAFMNDFSLLDIASEHGTPLYVYDWENIKNNISEFTSSFGMRRCIDMPPKLLFVKSLSRY